MNKQKMADICFRSIKGDQGAYGEWLMCVHSPNPRIQKLARTCMIEAYKMQRSGEPPSIIKQFMKEGIR